MPTIDRERAKKRCLGCGKALHLGKRKNASHCSRKCREAKYNRKRIHSFQGARNGGDRGCVSELLASAWFLEKGIEVYRALSQACSSDLVINTDFGMKTIQVRTGHYSSNKLRYTQNKKDESDFYFIVTEKEKHVIGRNNGVHYLCCNVDVRMGGLNEI